MMSNVDCLILLGTDEKLKHRDLEHALPLVPVVDYW